ncbi:Chlorophyllase [Melia azedarach]|uniref:Chlorophyllase n=1 Tax=Melia azedarach TaxID=155640 RepID=A0ACC1YUM1_MELAZ|nr:Chlorophyllase [Melia azedarach]
MAAVADAKVVSVEAKPVLATGTLPVFTKGTYSTKNITVETSSNTSSPPKPLFIVTPVEKGIYKVILFLHGTSLSNKSYSCLFEHMASHGFIVVAPQLYTSVPPPRATKELNGAAEVTNWLSTATGLNSNLPENVEANINFVALTGHSRGGQTAFALALGYDTDPKINPEVRSKFRAIIGIDPVAGTSKSTEVDPPILSLHSFNFTTPVVVIGTGLGGVSRCIRPCAPEGANHEEFFKRCTSSGAHFVTTDYGHLDMLDDNPTDLVSWTISKCMCKNGEESRDPMRRCVGGIAVAFLKDYFDGESGDFEKIMEEPSVAPIKLERCP